MNLYVLTFGFLILHSIVYSQDKIILEGRIVADSLENTRINIVNTTRKIGTTNSDLGEFKIEVQENDTLLFSSVHYEDVRIRISEKHIAERLVEVVLSEKVIDLKEVTIRNTILTGNLARDTEKIKTYNYLEGIPGSKIPRLTSIGRKLYTARDGDLDPLLNYISGRMQMLEKAIENEQLTFDVREGIDALEPVFFIQELEIPAQEIINFVYYCAASPTYRELIESNSYLELVELFKEKAPEFRQLRNIKPATYSDISN